MPEILVDNEGYNQFNEILQNIKDSLVKNALEGSTEYNDAGDGWHDNFSFDEVMRNERTIKNRIASMIEEQKHLKIIEDGYSELKVSIGDIVKIIINYDKNDIETQIVKLTGKYLPNHEQKIPEISLNSPIGRAIYDKKIPYKTHCMINDKKIEINIIEKRSSIN